MMPRICFSLLLAVLAAFPVVAQQWVWANSPTGLRDDYVNAVQTDLNGGVYVVGQFRGDIDFGSGVTFTTSNVYWKAYVAKYNYNGTFLWAREIGGNSADDTANDVEIDATGNVYVSVHSRSTAWTYDSFTFSGSGNDKSVILKLQPTGTLIWGQKLNHGSSNAWITGLAVRDTFVAAIGSYNYLDLLIGDDTLMHNNSEDIWIARYGTDSCTYHWSAYANSAWLDYGRHVALDDTGNVYFSGLYSDVVDINGQSALPHAGGYEGIVGKLDTNGNLDWVNRYYGQNDFGMDNLEILPNNELYFSGWHSSGTHDVGGLSYTVFTTHNHLVQRIGTDGTLVWSKIFSGGSLGRFNGMAVDTNYNLYLGGYLGSNIVFDTITVSSGSGSGNYNNFIAKLDSAGNVQYAATGGAYVYAFGFDQLAIDEFGAVYYGNSIGSTAQFDSITIGPPPDAYKDAYLAKFDPGACSAGDAGFTWSGTNLTQTFTTSDNSLVGWTWDFGTGDSSISAQPTFTFPATGTYQVCLTATNSCGPDTVCQMVSVSCPSVVAGFTYSDSLAQATFVDTSSGAVAVSWDFGDGATSTLAQPMHSYADTGSYTVCQIASNSCAADTFCQAINISCAVPVAAFSVSDSLLDVAFSNASTAGATAVWDFGDGASSMQSSPGHTYSDTGIYVVCLAVDNGCLSDTVCQSVVVSCPPLQANFGVVDTLLTISYSDSSTGASSLQWDFGDGNGSTQNFGQHSYASAGTYTMCLIGNNGCWADTACQTVSVACPGPMAVINLTQSNYTIDVVADTAAGASYIWDFGDFTAGFLQSMSHQYADTGVHEVCLIVSDSCGSDTLCQTVHIQCPQPTADFVLTQNELHVDFGFAGSGATSWSWDFGDGTTDTVPMPMHDYAMPGTYEACVVASNACGSASFCDSVSVTCSDIPQVSFAYSVQDSVVNFVPTIVNADSSWIDFGDGTAAAAVTQDHIYSAFQTYSVCMYASNLCGTDSFCLMVDVLCEAPQAQFMASDSGLLVQFAADTMLADSFYWQLEDGFQADGWSVAHAFATPGTYQACLVVSNHCGADTLCDSVTVDTLVGISSSGNLDSGFLMFPNPAATDLFIQIHGQVEASSIEIVDMNGKTVYLKKHEAASSYIVPLAGIASGVYIVRLKSAMQVRYKRLVVKR